MKYSTQLVHIDTIRPGDTVKIGGQLKTVGKNNLKYTSFMGRTLFGSNYMGGLEPVEKANIFKAMPTEDQKRPLTPTKIKTPTVLSSFTNADLSKYT